MTPEIAIVDSNTLSCLGLQNLLEEIIPTAIIRSFRSSLTGIRARSRYRFASSRKSFFSSLFAIVISSPSSAFQVYAFKQSTGFLGGKRRLPG